MATGLEHARCLADLGADLVQLCGVAAVTDIVERLRAWGPGNAVGELMHEAADEIERLRREVEHLIAVNVGGEALEKMRREQFEKEQRMTDRSA